MRVVQPTIDLNFARQETQEEIKMLAGKTYILPDYMQAQIKEVAIKNNHNLFKRDRELYQSFKKYNGQDLSDKVLLILRSGGIGDLIFLTPMVRHLKEKYPTARIVLICAPKPAELFKGLPFYMEVTSMPASLEELGAIAGYPLGENNTYAISFEGMIETHKDAKIKNVYNLHKDRFGIVEEIDYHPQIIIPSDTKEIVKSLYIPDDGRIKIAYQMTASSLVRSLKPMVTVDFLNRWEIPNCTFYILDSPSKFDFVTFYLKKVSNPKITIKNMTGSLNLVETAALVSSMDMVICPDSSISHMAACSDIPIVAFFGAFHSSLRLSHYKNVLAFDSMSSCPYAVDDEKKCCYTHDDICPWAMDLMRSYSPCMDLFKPSVLFPEIRNFMKQMGLLKESE